MAYKNEEILFKDRDPEMAGFLLSLYQFMGLNYSRFYKMDNLCKLGWLTSEILLAGSFNGKSNRPEETGLVIANANSSLDTDLRYLMSIQIIPSPSMFVYTLPNMMIGEICIRNNFKGEDSFFISPQFDPGFFYYWVDNLLNKNVLKSCIGGWVELLGNHYKSVLFLVEKGGKKESVPFTEKKIIEIFNQA
ncbi:MAG: hypothetical protein ACYCOO_10540 [Chitinophagaceae bacterium]